MDKQNIKTVRNQHIAAAVHAGHSWTRALDDKDSVTVPAYLPMPLSCTKTRRPS